MAATRHSISFTDFEEGIAFDDDDPDFHGTVNNRRTCVPIHQHSTDHTINININRHRLLSITEQEADLRSKWHIVRSNSTREKRKLKNISSIDSPKLKWSYLESISFSDKNSKPSESFGNVIPKIIPNIFNGNNEMQIASFNETLPSSETEIQTETLNQPMMGTTIYDPRVFKRVKTEDSAQGQVDTKYLKYFECKTSEIMDNSDPDLMFLRSLMPTIKQLNPLQNLEFKGEVIGLLKKYVTERE